MLVGERIEQVGVRRRGQPVDDQPRHDRDHREQALGYHVRFPPVIASGIRDTYTSMSKKHPIRKCFYLEEKVCAVNVQIDRTRFVETMRTQAEIGSTDDGGLHRLTLSDADEEVRDWFLDAMEDAGLETRIDEMGNMFGRRSGTDPSAPWSSSAANWTCSTIRVMSTRALQYGHCFSIEAPQGFVPQVGYAAATTAGFRNARAT